MNTLTMKQEIIEGTNNEVRESMRVIPEIFQPFLTWITGKPYKGQKAWHRTPSYHLVTATSVLILGVWGTVYSMMHQGLYWVLLPLTWLLTVSAGRKFQAMIIHQCSHYTFFASHQWNIWFGEFLSTILLLRDFDSYLKDHGPNHHSKKLLTFADETVKSKTES